MVSGMSSRNYFNYISFYKKEKISGETSNLSMSLDRILEYTPKDISNRLSGLDSSSLDFMESLPTFLCSEIDNAGAMVVKYGIIRKLTKRSSDLEFSFSTLIDFGTVNFESAHDAAKALGIHSYQPYRTHWAVMLGKADTVVQSLNALKPGTEVETDATALNAEIDIPPAAKPIGSAKSVESFLEHVFSVTTDEDVEYFFRGHEKSSFTLVPSIMREWENGAPKFLPNEERMSKELLITHYGDFQNDQFCFDRLVRMQHYGLPTRLLDLSGNPLIALYFACEKASEEDGEVVIFGIRRDIIKYYDSDTVSCISNLSKLTAKEKDGIDISLDRDAFNISPSVLQLLHHIKSEKGYFDGRIEPEHIGSILCVKAKRNNIRIKSQHGAFLLFGHGAKMPAEGIDGISVRRVTIKNKSEILNRLNSININSSTIYPSMENSAIQIKDAHTLPEK